MALEELSALTIGVVGTTVKMGLSRAIIAKTTAIGGREIANLSANWRLPENHDVQKVLRRAQFTALKNLLSDFEAWSAKNAKTSLSPEEGIFVAATHRFADAGTRASDDVSQVVDAKLLEATAASIDKALAGRLGKDDRADAMRRLAENHVFDELTSAASKTAPVPQRFTEFFYGRYRHEVGWHTRFVAYASEQLKTNAAYSAIFEAEKLCVLVDGSARIEEKLDSSEHRAAQRHDETQGRLDQLGNNIEAMQKTFLGIYRLSAFQNNDSSISLDIIGSFKVLSPKTQEILIEVLNNIRKFESDRARND